MKVVCVKSVELFRGRQFNALQVAEKWPLKYTSLLNVNIYRGEKKNNSAIQKVSQP